MKYALILNALFTLTLSAATTPAAAPTPGGSLNEMGEQSPRLMVHLLDYLGLDYPGAIQNGKVVSDLEYNEMKEFSETLIQLNTKFPETRGIPSLATDLQELKKQVHAKAGAEKINKLSQDIKWKIVGVTGMVLAPDFWPNQHRGKRLFAENCAKCHGASGHGDGPSAAEHDPRPSNFHEAEKMGNFSAFQAFNAIRLGVPGTAMAAQTSFSDPEVWDLAYYVLSLRYQGKGSPSAKQPELTLQQASTLSDTQLFPLLPGESTAEKHAALAGIRLYSSEGQDAQAFIDLARSSLNAAMKDYREKNFDSAKRHALVAYLNGIEPVEPRIRANDPSLLVEIEQRMTTIRSGIDRREELAVLEEKTANALDTIVKVENSLSRKTSPGMTFTVSAGIVLREAFEAIFLLIALLGVIRSVGSARAAFFVHLGWLSAVGAGFVLWFFSGWVMRISGAGREILEGTVSLIAVIVVLYMGFWLHRKTEMSRWRNFLNEMAQTIVSGKSLFLLAGISFMAVFREAFETVLFLRAVLLESGGLHQTALVGGVLSALLAVVVLAVALVRFSAKLPIRRLFDLSAMVMVALAFVLMGKAIHSFQEAGLLSVTESPFGLRSDLMGIYPSYETLVPQLIILVISLAFWWSGKKPMLGQMQQVSD